MLRVSLNQLEALFWVARLGSFRAAADHLGLSQPTITLRIRHLEQAIDTTLFDRSGYRPVLTAEGTEVLRYAQQTLSFAERIEAFRDAAAAPAKLLRFGIADYEAMTKMGTLLRVFEENFPDLHIDITVDYSAKLNALLADRKLDLAVLTEPKRYPELEAIPVGEVPLLWVASSMLQLENKKLQPKDLVSQRIVTNPPPSNIYQSILDWFDAAGPAPERLSTCNTLQGIRQLIVEGFAVGLLPPLLLQTHPGEAPISVLNVSKTVKPHKVFVAYNNDNNDTTLQAVLRLVVDTLISD